ncbi:mitochondrial fission ELM1 family protein [Litoribrevibacter albus]|uniref:Nucleoside-diphosphate sugar epimerase n=1 Tax=Litoribrevibacter albus TaxID=1473156 RepID=A0AA37SED2_9GAMM|nr:ELM1/GtrOC1 family putative glycosyltransferase [Litoribrevibacter albus]GLQ32509.1 nucleoside-diphosphate sugar epimerase [Litoribrevibacter albus]
MSDIPIKICFVTDEKPGHKNQLLGLEQSLRMQTQIESIWISARETTASWFDVIAKRCQVELDWIPDVVVGAGNSTHKLVLAIKRKFQCFSVILMKPSLIPMSWFDALIVPEHDNPSSHVNVYSSCGVLNKIRPRGVDYRTTGRGLILIGGDSKHYQWDSSLVCSQIERVISKTRNVKDWLIADSRRTPVSFELEVHELMKDVITYISHYDTSPEWLPEQMSKSDCIWVTPDSVSMVYEALTSGAEVGVFDLPVKKNNRITKGVDSLRRDQRIMSVDNMLKIRAGSVFGSEADRAAKWLLDCII